MKTTGFLSSLRAMALTLFATMLGYWALAQDGAGASVNVTTSKTSSSTDSGWYTSPWVWVVGGAVFVLLLVALLNNRGGSRSNNA